MERMSQPAPAHDRQAAIALIAHYVPIVRWLPAYDRANLRFDAIAGVVSWGVMVPVAMAYAGLAGVPPELGLVTAFTALAAYAVFGTSRHLKVTASSSIAIMSASVVGAIAASQIPGNYVALSAGLALAVGAILVVAGAVRLGFLSQFLAASVVTGFVIGLRGRHHGRPDPGAARHPGRQRDDHRASSSRSAGELDEIDVDTAILGVGTLVGIIVLRRVAPRLPGPLIALVVGIVASTALDLPAAGRRGRRRRGDRDPAAEHPGDRRRRRHLPRHRARSGSSSWPSPSRSAPPARSARGTATTSIPTRSSIALGASNVASGLFGGFAVDARLSQSATGEAAGNRTQLATLITAGLILATRSSSRRCSATCRCRSSRRSSSPRC